MQVDSHHQLGAQLFVDQIQHFAARIDNLQQRVVHFAIHFAAMPFLQFGDEFIALEQGITLLVNLKLFESQVGDAGGHILQFIRRRQRLLLLIKNTRQQQASLQDGNLLFYVTFRLQRAVEPGFHLDILLHQLVTAFGGGNQLLA